VSHFSPVPPGEREYAENYRKELEPFEAQLVEVSGRCKEFRDHPERKDLQSLLLINLTIRTFNKKNLIKLSHLWVLTKHVQRAGVEPKIGRRVKFSGPVYAYYRLGGKSKQRGLHGLHDFSILPMESTATENFEPGLTNRYEKTSTRDDGTDSEGGSCAVGEGAPIRPEDSNSRRRDNRAAEPGSEDGGGEHLPHKRSRKARPKRSRKPPKADPDGGTKNPRD